LETHIQPEAIPVRKERAFTMVSMKEVEAAVDSAKGMLSESGIDLDVTADQLWEYFETDLPVPDISLGDVILNPFLVVHELVEIDEVLKMGLAITKYVIVRNPEKVDDAHLTAARIELMVAERFRATEHIRDRIGNIEKWTVDETLSEDRKTEYRRLLADAREALSRLQF
jgi:hypothetical protein